MTETSTGIAEGVREICEAFRDGLRGVLGNKLFGIHLYGALTFPETKNTGDIDFPYDLCKADYRLSVLACLFPQLSWHRPGMLACTMAAFEGWKCEDLLR